MTVTRCVFCGREEDDFKGTYLIKNEGTMAYYCSNKCRKNHLKLGRDGRRVRWTQSFRDERVRKAASDTHAKTQAKMVSDANAAKKAAPKKK